VKGRRKKAEANSAAWKASKEKVPYHKFAKERDPQQSNRQNSGEKPVWHSEDLALKTAAQYFGAELMPLLGIPGTVEYIAPTETVKLEARHFYQDFNYATNEKSWIHFEFESDHITNEDLKRFREYEAATSRAHNVDVITYVICSANVKNPRYQLISGINVYRVRIIRLKGRDSDLLFKAVEEKKAGGEALTKADLVPLLLTSLMSGSMKIKERIIRSLKILYTARDCITPLEMEKMQAVLYTFADKFLNKNELANVKEVITMTTLGRMIFNDGVEKGIRAMVLENLEEDVCEERICEKLQKHFSLTREEAEEKVQKYKTQE
jgi:hypothetical protein